MQLRYYQKIVLNKLFIKLKTTNKIALSLPTGAGKTVMMVEWAKAMYEKYNHSTVIIVDRIELVQQTYDAFDDKSLVSVMKAGWRDDSYDETKPFQIIMLQTGYRRLSQLLNLSVNYVFFDEVHNYYNGEMFAALSTFWPNAKIIGVSATPINEKGYLLEGFDDYINDVQTQDLINWHYLTRPIYLVPKDYNLDLSCIRITNGDYDSNELDQIMIDVSRIEKIYRAWNAVARNRKTIAFCNSIKQAEQLNLFFYQNGVNCRVIHSKMEILERLNVLYNFKIGIVNVIFNVGILVAGFDEPSVDCILFANPTKILRRYLQQAGRGLRIYPNKQDCLMIDCAGVVREHGQCDDLRFYKLKQKTTNEANIKDCPECGAIVSNSTKECPYCGYQFTNTVEAGKLPTKKQLQQLEKAYNAQQELKKQIAEVVATRGHKAGYSWFLFIKCLKNKRPTESSIRFFKRKMTKLNKIKSKGWKLESLKYD